MFCHDIHSKGQEITELNTSENDSFMEFYRIKISLQYISILFRKIAYVQFYTRVHMYGLIYMQCSHKTSQCINVFTDFPILTTLAKLEDIFLLYLYDTS